MSIEITILSGVVSLLIGYIFGKMYQENKRKHRVPKARNPMPPPKKRRPLDPGMAILFDDDGNMVKSSERGAGDDYPVITPQNWK